MASGCVPRSGGRRAGLGRGSSKSLLASERSERDTLWSVQLRIADNNIMVRAIFVLITRKEGGA